MNVLIIPEDFRNDQYVLKPIFNRLLRNIGKTRFRVRVCNDPLLMGVANALNTDSLQEIVEDYPMYDLFILCVDRDCNVNRRDRLDQIEDHFGASFFAVNAWEEIETWVLAGVDTPTNWRWSDIRAECDVKERYFLPLVHQRRLTNTIGGGRKTLGEEASRRINAIRQKCPEDFDALARRLEKLT